MSNEKTVKRNPFVAERLQRIDDLLEYLKDKNPAKLSQLLGVFGVKYGLTEVTIESYLRQLEAAGKIKINRLEDTVQLI